MCDHCSCRQFPAIAELSEEHEAILGVARELELFPAAMFGFEDDDWAVLDATDRFVVRVGAARQS